MITWLLLAIMVVTTVLGDVLQSHEMKRTGAQKADARGLLALIRIIGQRTYLILAIVCMAVSFFCFHGAIAACSHEFCRSGVSGNGDFGDYPGQNRAAREGQPSEMDGRISGRDWRVSASKVAGHLLDRSLVCLPRPASLSGNCYCGLHTSVLPQEARNACCRSGFDSETGARTRSGDDGGPSLASAAKLF